MTQFRVPKDGVFTWDQEVEVTAPGRGAETLTATFKTLNNYDALVADLAGGDVSIGDFIRAFLVAWDVADDDGPVPLDGEVADSLFSMGWFGLTVIKAYGDSVGGATAKNALTSGVPSPVPTTGAPPANRHARRAATKSKKT
ncbi:hypothetical protein [uncultured Rhodospira sp.]|uniref:hypothetical protein n=1 Tax=uncultured Rhodospira sp. TaxID=1936189 RepID=UPI002636FFCD|nr:hypothetical protein [uncultured Rhodospira sp.]